jgi:two-component system sensor histidine kinase CpxA
VPKEELANIFRPFYRVSDARERQSGGTGLGLAIAHRIVALHGGSIRANNANGGGLEVELRLPASTAS